MTNLETAIAEFSDFRRALRKADQEVFDRLMDLAREHAEASRSHQGWSHTDALFMSICIGLMRKAEKIEAGRGKED